MFRSLRTVVVVFASAVATATGRGTDPDVDTALAAHAATVAGIETFHCKVRLETAKRGDGMAGQASGRYARTSGHEGVWMAWADRTATASIEADRVVSLLSRRQGAAGQAHQGWIIPYQTRSPDWFDVWSATLFGFGRGTDATTRSLQAAVGGVPLTSSRTTDGLVVIEGRSALTAGTGKPSHQVRAVLDPRRNYLVTEFELTRAVPRPGSTTGKIDVLRDVRTAGGFKEVVPGRYVPTTTTFKKYWDDAVAHDERATLSDIRVNEPIPDAEFAVIFPTGTEVLDKVKGVEYTAGVNGQPAAEPTQYRPGVAFAADATQQPPKPGRPTAAEPRATGWWVLPAAVGVLLTAVAVWGLRRRRANE